MHRSHNHTERNLKCAHGLKIQENRTGAQRIQFPDVRFSHDVKLNPEETAREDGNANVDGKEIRTVVEARQPYHWNRIEQNQEDDDHKQNNLKNSQHSGGRDHVLRKLDSFANENEE